MSVAYIALGSNVGDRLDYLRRGKNAIESKLNVTAISPVYETEPIDTADAARFLNAVLAVRTDMTPEELLSLCLTIEQENGRIRSARNAPRTLDLDLLLYDDMIIDEERLTLPHPRMHERAFVLVPLADIAADIAHPKLGVSIRVLLEQREDKEQLVRRTDYSL